MALIKLGPVVGDARGSVGSTVFSRNRFGPYMKQRTKPTYPATQKQNTATALMANIVDSWASDLSVAQRTLWNNAVKLFTVPNALGDAVTLTGLQWFVRCNILLDLGNTAAVTVPPVRPIMPAPTLTLAHVAASGIEVSDIGPWDTAEVDRVLIGTSPDLPQTINYYKAPWASKTSIPATSFDILPFVMLASGLLTVNTRLFFRFRTIKDDGANSFPVIYSVDVGDPV